MMSLMVIDSNNLAYRNFHTIKDLSHGEKKVAVVFGFLNQLLTLREKVKNADKLFDEIIFCWDSKKSFRKIIYPGYKSGREKNKKKKTKEELFDLQVAHNQFIELRKEILPKLGFKNVFHQIGFEADDIVSQIVKDNIEKHIVVVSADQDFYQILPDGTTAIQIWNYKKFQTGTGIFLTYGIKPSRWIDVKILAGCNSDDIDGIERVGEKTAIKWILGTLKKGKIYDRIAKEENSIREKNFPVVKLPFELRKLSPIEVKKSVLYKDDFIDVFESFNFQSFLRKNKWKKWCQAFDLKG